MAHNFPTEIIRKIIRNTDSEDIVRASLVSKHWRHACDTLVKPIVDIYSFSNVCRSGDIYSVIRAPNQEGSDFASWLDRGLYYALTNCHLPLAKLLCRKFDDLGIENPLGKWGKCKDVTELFSVACEHSHIRDNDEVVEWLGLGWGDYINFNEGFMNVCSGNRRDLVEKLVQWGADDFDSALGIACAYGTRDIAEYLVKMGATDFNNAMRGACSTGNWDMVEWAIGMGADNFSGALFDTASRGSLDWCKRMVYAGANINKALFGACRNEHHHIIEWAIEMGANDFDDGLKYACYHGSLSVAKLMVQLGATSKGDGLVIASQRGRISIVEWLVSIDINTRNLNDALIWASYNGYVAIAKILIDAGAHPTMGLLGVRYIKENYYKPYDYDLAKYLIKMGANLNAVLLAICQTGDLKTIKRLVKQGADNYDEAITASIGHNHPEVARWLSLYRDWLLLSSH